MVHRTGHKTEEMLSQHSLWLHCPVQRTSDCYESLASCEVRLLATWVYMGCRPCLPHEGILCMHCVICLLYVFCKFSNLFIILIIPHFIVSYQINLIYFQCSNWPKRTGKDHRNVWNFAHGLKCKPIFTQKRASLVMNWGFNPTPGNSNHDIFQTSVASSVGMTTRTDLVQRAWNESCNKL